MSACGPIGLVAVEREAHPLLEHIRERKVERQGEALLHQGQLGGRQVVLAKVLPGPVNAALGAQALAVCHGVRCLIGFGSAGALDPSLSAGDVIIARRTVAHDAGAFLGQRFVPGGVMGRDELGRAGHRRTFEADRDLVAQALDAAGTLDGRVYAGTIATGNQAIFSTARRRWLWETFNALAVEMETAAMAQVAVAYRLPWVAVRAISDMAGDELILDYTRIRIHLDDAEPAWRHLARRWRYLLSHPGAWRTLRRLRRGLASASGKAARVVEVMIRV